MEPGSRHTAGQAVDAHWRPPEPSIGVLGTITLLDGDASLGGPKQRLVLAMLAADVGRVVRSDLIADAVWGDDAQRRRRSLQVLVSNLRGALGERATIEHRSGGYVLREAPGALDASCFVRLVDEALALPRREASAAIRRLRAGASLWRGPPFGDLATEPALALEVARLEELRTRAMQALARLEIDRGEAENVIGELQQLVATHPLREPLWHLLVLALYRSGRQAEALEQYERARRTLAVELGADPSRPLQELHAAMLRQDPAPDEFSGGGSSALSRHRAELSGVGRVRSSMVGRDEEWAVVQDLLAAAAEGSPGVLLVGGEAGIGKSRLVAEAGEEARGLGMQVRVGRCLEVGEGPMPYAPVAHFLRSVVRGRSRADADALVGGRRSDLVGLVHELGEGRDGPPVDDAVAPGQMLVAVATVIERLAGERPLLLVLEDLHWADASTLDLLHYLARTLGEVPILVVGTYRVDELDRRHPLRLLLGELARLPHVERIDLRPLDPDDATALVRRLLGGTSGADIVETVARRSGGNPFYVEELVSAHRAGRPTGLGAELRDVVASRLGRLPEQSLRLVEVVAVAGGDVDERLLAAIAGEGPGELLSTLRPSVDRRVLVTTEDGYRFAHDLVREVVVDDLLPGARMALHRRVAGALERHPETAPGGAAAAAAYAAHHWRAARDDQMEFDACLRAVADLRSVGAVRRALELDERVLELWNEVDRSRAPDRATVCQRAADSARLAARHRRCAALYREALADAGVQGELEAELRCSLALAIADARQGASVALVEMQRALDLIDDCPETPRTIRVLHAAARLRLIHNQVDDETVELARRAHRAATTAGASNTELHAAITLGSLIAARSEHGGAGFAQLRDALALARRRGDLEATSRAFNNLVVAHRSCDAGAAALEADLDVARTWLRGLDVEEFMYSNVLLLNIALTAAEHGAWERVDEVLATCRHRRLDGHSLAAFHIARAKLRWAKGQLAAARDDVGAALAANVDDPTQVDDARLVEASVAVDAGDLETVRRVHRWARRVSEGAATGASPGGRVVTLLHAAGALVRAEVDATLAARDAADRADHLRRADSALTEVQAVAGQVEQEPALAGSVPSAWVRAVPLVAAAERSRTGRADVTAWQLATRACRREPESIYATWRLGQAMLASGEEDGADLIDRAARAAAAAGFSRLHSQIRDEAEGQGAP